MRVGGWQALNPLNREGMAGGRVLHTPVLRVPVLTFSGLRIAHDPKRLSNEDGHPEPVALFASPGGSMERSCHSPL